MSMIQVEAESVSGNEDVLTKQRRIATSPKNAILSSVEDVLYGSFAGIVGKYIEYPFDTVKVRLQSQPDHLPLRYKGPLDCFRQSWRADGVSGLYRGISAPLVGAALENSSLFLWEQIAQKALFASGTYTINEPLPLPALFTTGAISGAATSLVLTPVELVKCKMQVPNITTSDGYIKVAPTPMAIIRNVWRHQGLMGFFNGQMGTLIRETGGCAAWFGSKETVTRIFRQFNDKRAGLEPSNLSPIPIWQQAVAGATAGMSYNFLFFPADTVKSRLQTRAIEDSGKRPNFWTEGAALWKQHGLKGMYRGCGITVARSAPSSAFIFVIYDALKNQFPMS